jgi:hypothetical protein
VSRSGEESKPPWRAIPPEIRVGAERVLGARVARAARVWGGYAPSVTYRLVLADGRRAFFKGINASSNEYMHRALRREERAYRRLSKFISPWAPDFRGAFRRADWHVLLLEDVGPATVPPWTSGKARAAAREYARFHRSTLGKPLPSWLSRRQHREFAYFWRDLIGRRLLGRAAALAGPRALEARHWLRAAVPELRGAGEMLARAEPPHALLHFDARSDNIRISRGRLRIFDWPFVSVGPAEFDLAAFAQSVACEGGPSPEAVVAAYAEVLEPREDVLTASVAAIPGYFCDRAWRAPIPGLPRLRSIQRRQLRASLSWAARRLALPEPTWLTAVRP